MASSILRQENCGGSDSDSNQISPFQMVCALFLPPRVRGPCRVCQVPGKRHEIESHPHLMWPFICLLRKKILFINRLFTPLPLVSSLRTKRQSRLGRRAAVCLSACLPAFSSLSLLSPPVSHDITINVLTFTTPPLHADGGREGGPRTGRGTTSRARKKCESAPRITAPILLAKVTSLRGVSPRVKED